MRDLVLCFKPKERERRCVSRKWQSTSTLDLMPAKPILSKIRADEIRNVRARQPTRGTATGLVRVRACSTVVLSCVDVE